MNYSREGYEPYISQSRKTSKYSNISLDMDYAFNYDSLNNFLNIIEVLESYREYIESRLRYLCEKYSHKNATKKTYVEGFKDIIFYNVENGKAKFLALELICFLNSLLDFHFNIKKT